MRPGLNHIGIFIVLLITLLTASGLKTLSQEKSSLQEGIQLFKTGKYNESLVLFRKFIKTKPGDPEINFYLGASFVELGLFPDSAFHSLNFASQEEGFEKSFFYIGLLNHHTKDWNEALKYYNRFKNQATNEEITLLNLNDLIDRCSRKMAAPDPGVGHQPAEMVITEVKAAQPLKPDSVDTAKTGNQALMNVWIDSNDEKINKDSMAVSLPVTGTPFLNDSLKTGISGGLPVQDTISSSVRPDSLTTALPADKDSVIRGSFHAPDREIIEFQINDNITYLFPDHFQTTRGKQLFLEGRQTKSRLDSLFNGLEILRKQYETQVSETDKEKTGKQIIESENMTSSLMTEYSEKFGEVRNIEDAIWKEKPESETRAFRAMVDSLRSALQEKNSVPVSLDSTVIMTTNGFLRTGTTDRKPKPPEKKVEELTIYKIQLGIFKGTPPASFQGLLKKLSLIRKIDSFKDEKGYNVYTTGSLSSYADAGLMLQQVKQEGVKNPIIVAFRSGKKITLQEALNNSAQK